MVSVRAVMSTGVVTVVGVTPMVEAARHMVRRHIGSVLVVDGSMLSGILTERDVLRAAAKPSDMAAEPASRWMSPEPICCSPEIDTEEAAEMMLSGGFRHLPVLDGGELLGIVSLRDVLSARIGRKG
ncbi:MAG: CBS domain-containing protein [bacterium]|nr:CBS domain-containing protein [bacterium]